MFLFPSSLLSPYLNHSPPNIHLRQADRVLPERPPHLEIHFIALHTYLPPEFFLKLLDGLGDVEGYGERLTCEVVLRESRLVRAGYSQRYLRGRERLDEICNREFFKIVLDNREGALE